MKTRISPSLHDSGPILVGIDTETGHVGAHNATEYPLLSVGVYTELPSGPYGLELKIMPGNDTRMVHPEAQAVNGFTVDGWEECGAMEEADALMELVFAFIHIHRETGRRIALVAHNAPHDQAWLVAAFYRAGLGKLWEGLQVRMILPRWECSMGALAFAKRAFPWLHQGACSLNSLTALRTGEHYTEVVDKRVHGAEEDARLCYLGYCWLVVRVAMEGATMPADEENDMEGGVR